MTTAQKAELAESLRKLLKERATIYNDSLRKQYDGLISYYESQLY